MRAIVLVALLASTASANPVSVTGAPMLDKGATVASIENVRALMGVCWQKKPPATVKIAVSVSATGDVVKATAKTKGAAAQCAAGILAVSTLTPPAKAWKGTITIESAAGGKSADAVAIHEDLAKHGDVLFACQAKQPDFAGTVKLTVTVAQDGTISEATADPANIVGKCAAGAAKKLALSPITSDQVTYTLSLNFQGGDDAAAPEGGGDPALAPSKKGPLEIDDLAPVLANKKAALGKCAKGTKARGKVVVRLAIGGDGKVSSTKVKSSELDDATVEACFAKALGDLTFRVASGETVVLYPIRVDDDGVKTGS